MAVRRTRQTSACLAAAGCVLLGFAGDGVAQLARSASPVDRFRSEQGERVFMRISRPMAIDAEAQVRQMKAAQKRMAAARAREAAKREAKKATDGDAQETQSGPKGAQMKARTKKTGAPGAAATQPEAQAPATQPGAQEATTQPSGETK